jgi:hypothetical protein
MTKVAYTVICPFNEKHKFPAVYEIEDEATGVKSPLIEYCPFCDKPVEVRIEGKVTTNTNVLRSFGFEH